jgi:5-methyltetrahydrofolate--homocysteine methyltransferase
VAIDVHFTEQDWERIRRDWCAWWDGELERCLVVIDGMPAPDDPGLEFTGPWEGYSSNFPIETPLEEVLAFFEPGLRTRRALGDGWPRWWPNFGPGIVAGFLGARLQLALDTVWFDFPRRPPFHEIRLMREDTNPWWIRIRDITRAAIERWGASLTVGFSDLGGNLDILASVRSTQQLLLDLVDSPEEVARLSGEITRLWLGYYDDLYSIIGPAGRGTWPWAPIWSPGRCYMLQSDFSYMISPAMFERFVLPDLDACCAALDHAFYHLDGKGQIRHLEMLLSLPGLDGIQWVPGDGAPPSEEWLPLLSRIRAGGKRCQTYVSAEGARKIVRELGGRGFAFYITEPLFPDDAQALLSELKAP